MLNVELISHYALTTKKQKMTCKLWNKKYSFVIPCSLCPVVAKLLLLEIGQPFLLPCQKICFHSLVISKKLQRFLFDFGIEKKIAIDILSLHCVDPISIP
jgi:hypothetical protein